MQYALGTAEVDGETQAIFSVDNTLYDLGYLLRNLPAGKELGFVPSSDDPVTVAGLLDDWEEWKPVLRELSDSLDPAPPEAIVAPSEVEWKPPVLYPSKVICIGANYREHIEEMDTELSLSKPYSFLKPPTTALLGSGRTLQLPDHANKVDWEAELAVVMGREARNVSGDEALSAIAGYTAFNDISARDWLHDSGPLGIDWVRQKAVDGFAPIGPLLLPAEFIDDPHDLGVKLTLNEEPKQDSNTGNMIFGISDIIEHLSTTMTLEPGDVIATGTPSGVGISRTPPEYLETGDHMVVEIEGIPPLTTPVR